MSDVQAIFNWYAIMSTFFLSVMLIGVGIRLIKESKQQDQSHLPQTI